MTTDRRITLEGYLQKFRDQDRNQSDQPFCFILGAGASKTSGIRMGGELARQFLRDLFDARNLDGLPLEQWSTDQLGLAGFSLDRVGEFYPELYEQLFGEHLDRGYAFLEKEMEDKEPSYGYSVLAWILENTSHKVVITTNFDNLVADALSIHSATFPRVVGHDSLVGFIKAALRRPLIAKVHGDLGFAPRNTAGEIGTLSDGWKEALERVLERFTPIVIGYGGNDGSLMKALESLRDGVPESVYWCQRDGDPTTGRVNELIEQRKGNLVLIPGFDEVMLRIQDQMRDAWNMPDLLDEMKDRQRRREASYEKQRDEIGARLTARKAAPRLETTPATIDAAEEAEQRRVLAGAARRTLAPKDRKKPWWEWQNEANAEEDADKRNEIYQRGLQARPESHELMGNYANFLKTVRKDYDRTEEYYQKALESDPEHANNLGNYAVFLETVRKDYDRAEEYYQKALESDPEHASHLGNYALFLETVRKDYDRAEEYYQKALESDPEHAEHLGNYAQMLFIRGQKPEALEMLKRSESCGGDNDSLHVELLFYRIAHDAEAWPGQLNQLRTLLSQGARSPDWALEENIKRAEKDGHPNPALLRALANVINDQSPLSSLDEYPEWRDAAE